MKKMLSLVIVCVLVFSFAGCGCEKSAPYSMGVMTGNTYENSLLGIGISLPDDWELTSVEDLALLNGLESGLSKEEIETALSKIDSAGVFSAENYESGNAISINLQKLSALENVFVGIGTKTEGYMDEVIAELVDTMPETLEGDGLSVNNVYATKVSIGGTTMDAVETECCYDEYGLDYYMRQILLVKDGYMAAISIGAFSKADLDEITAYIYTI